MFCYIPVDAVFVLMCLEIREGAIVNWKSSGKARWIVEEVNDVSKVANLKSEDHNVDARRIKLSELVDARMVGWCSSVRSVAFRLIQGDFTTCIGEYMYEENVRVMGPSGEPNLFTVTLPPQQVLLVVVWQFGNPYYAKYFILYTAPHVASQFQAQFTEFHRKTIVFRIAH